MEFASLLLAPPPPPLFPPLLLLRSYFRSHFGVISGVIWVAISGVILESFGEPFQESFGQSFQELFRSHPGRPSGRHCLKDAPCNLLTFAVSMDAILESFTEWEDPAGDDILQTKEQRPKQDDDGDLMVFHEKNMAEAAKEFMSHIKV